MAPHTIDILYFLLGKFSDATGFIANTGNLYDAEDTVSASFRFESGIIGSGLWCYVSSIQNQNDLIEFSGTKGIIRCSTFSFSPIELITDNRKEYFDIPSPQHIQQPMIQSIVNEIRGNGICPSTGETGIQTSWIIDKIFRKL